MSEVVLKTCPSESGLPMSVQASGPTVLVVDDHADTRTLLRYVLESHHYQVAEATDGREAIHIAATVVPDLIIMDMTLERMDGLEAMRCIRSINCTQNIPIVFLSGHAQPQARAVALAAGANDYLVKPVSIDTLEKVVAQQLSGVCQRAKHFSARMPGHKENYL